MLGQMPTDVDDYVASEGEGNDENSDARPAQNIPRTERNRDEADDEVNEEIQGEHVIGGRGESPRNRVGRFRLLAPIG
jgi:hypothetical protein